MSFRGLLRPGQGFQTFRVLRRRGGITKSGRPRTTSLCPEGEFLGIISQANPKDVEQFKQHGTPITHTIVQRGTEDRAKATDVLELVPDPDCCFYCEETQQAMAENRNRRFLIQAEPQDPGELGHFLVYHVEERADLQ